MNKIISLCFVVLLLAPESVRAQCDFTAGAGFVSSYVWRGVATAGTSIQPSMGLSAGGFNFGAWGSVDISRKGYKEVDIAASYTIGGFSMGLTDYWWDVGLTAAIGASPWNSNVLYTSYEKYGQSYGTAGFAVTNISLATSKDIAINDKFQLPVSVQLAFNPAKEDVFMVFGLSFNI